jgi:hypothetical protein
VEAHSSFKEQNVKNLVIFVQFVLRLMDACVSMGVHKHTHLIQFALKRDLLFFEDGSVLATIHTPSKSCASRLAKSVVKLECLGGAWELDPKTNTLTSTKIGKHDQRTYMIEFSAI